MTALSPRTNIAATRSRWRSLMAVATAAILGASMLYVSAVQQRSSQDNASALTGLRTARVDLARGMLDVALANASGSPFDADQGFALLEQAVDDLEALARQVKPADLAPDSDLSGFAEQVAALRSEFARRAGNHTPLTTRELAVAVSAVERQAAIVDAGLVSALRRLSFENDRRFRLLQYLAIVLLSVLCIVVFISERAHYLTIASLERSNLEIRALFDLLPAKVWTQDASHRIVRINQLAAEAVGLPETAIQGRPIAEVMPDEAAHAADDLEVLQSGRPQLNRIEQRRGPDGRRRWYSTSKLSFHQDGRPVGLLAVSMDITEQHQVTVALRDERNRLVALAATSPSVLHSFREGPDGTMSFPYASPRIHEIYGVTPEALAGDASMAAACWHPDDVPRLMSTIAESRRRMEPWHQEFRVRHPTRGEIWVEGHSMPQQDADGGCTWHGALTDITERRRVYEELQSRGELLERTGAIAHVGGWYYDVRSGDSGWTRELARIFNLDPDSRLSPSEGWQYFPPEARAQVETAFGTALATGVPYDLEVPFVSAAGVTRWLRVIGQPVLQDGRVVRVYGSMLDVTERRQLEMQLRQSQKMEAIGQLAGGVAHDFNNLLTVILGNAEHLAQRLSPDGDELGEIVDAATRAANLTRQLLLLGRRQVLQPVPLDLNEVVGTMTKLLQRILGEDITLRADFAPGLPTVFADRGMMEQVLLNLAVNSRDAMPSGGQLTISTGIATHDVVVGAIDGPAITSPDADDNRQWVRLAVADTGHGISADVLSHIFEPFFTTKEAGHGTGLGLATVYGIVEQHDGRINVQSTVGAGTAFEVFLPAKAATRLGEPVTPPTPAPRASAASGCILVVEDEAAVRHLAERVLVRRGYKVLTADSGPAALEVWRRHRDDIDLVLADVVMPDGLSGPELVRQILDDRPDVKAVLTSGYSPEVARRHMAAMPEVGFIQKPYRMDDLLALIAGQVGRTPP